MKNINHRNIRLICENLTIRDTVISYRLPLPKFILDDKGRLFLKNKAIFEAGQEVRTGYSETSVTVLSNIEISGSAIEVKPE